MCWDNLANPASVKKKKVDEFTLESLIGLADSCKGKDTSGLQLMIILFFNQITIFHDSLVNCLVEWFPTFMWLISHLNEVKSTCDPSSQIIASVKNMSNFNQRVIFPSQLKSEGEGDPGFHEKKTKNKNKRKVRFKKNKQNILNNRIIFLVFIIIYLFTLTSPEGPICLFCPTKT